MFIDKARHLEHVHAVGGIVIDHNLSLTSSSGSMFSMTGDGNNNVQIPLVLMFKDEAFQLLHLLSKQPQLIVYIGDENYLMESFYQQIDYLESLVDLLKQKTLRWFYGQQELFDRKTQCFIVPKSLEKFELTIQQYMNYTNNDQLSEHSSNATADTYRTALDKLIQSVFPTDNQISSSNTTATSSDNKTTTDAQETKKES
ncbi:hypothetical protein I4U23_001512 [Adineta vaga]|nr:hypothetical protein I4U23_001512 [Adineta vaga]